MRSASEGSLTEGEMEGVLIGRAGVIKMELEEKLEELTKYFESNFSKEKHGAFVNSKIEGIRKYAKDLKGEVRRVGRVLDMMKNEKKGNLLVV